MNVIEELKRELAQLPFFINLPIRSIIKIKQGLSQICFKVTDEQGTDYFVKHFSELGHSLIEYQAGILASKNNLSAQVLFQNRHWLVASYLEGESLASDSLPLKMKIQVALKLLSEFHQLTAADFEIGQQLAIRPLDFIGLIQSNYAHKVTDQASC